ncbi:MAG: hypothetical protein V1913_02010 [Fibrobacterota bacterium]
MAATLPLNGNGDITQNSTTPADGLYKLANIGAGGDAAGKKLTIEGSNAAGAGSHDGGDIVLMPGLSSAGGTSGVVKAYSQQTEIQFVVYDTYPRIKFVGGSAIINWPSSDHIYFGETSYTGNFLVRGAKVGINTTSPGEKLEVSGNIKATGGGYNNGHLVLGGYHLYVDGTGDLRIKNGAPTYDGDGTVVGTQS